MFYVLSVRSESGDEYPPMVFKEKPNDEKLKSFLQEIFPDEWGDGPGIFGSYLYVRWSCSKLFVL